MPAVDSPAARPSASAPPPLAAGALRPRPRPRRAARPVRARRSTPSAPPRAAGAGWRTTRVLRAPRRFDLVGLRWARGARAEAQVRARRRGGALDARGSTLHAPATTGPTARARRRRHRPGVRRAPPTSSSCACAAPRAACAPASCARCRPRPSRAASASACAAAPRVARARSPAAPRDHHPRRVGRRLACPPRAAPELRRGPGSRSCTTRSPRTTTRPEDSAGDRARHRALPPRLQRLERHRLQLPRRQVRPGLRGPRGRHRRSR